MAYTLNETHNPDAFSWVASANAPDTDFPVQNLPFGVFRPRDTDEPGRVGVAIGDRILDVAAAHRAGLFQGRAADAADRCEGASLNGFLALGPDFWSALRRRLSELLRANHPDAAHHRQAVGRLLVAQSEAELLLPAEIGDYTDFYASLDHATNVGRMFRPDKPLLPNYRHLPVGYHGRASSIVVSGTPVRRPWGQSTAGSEPPVFRPTARLDYEVELAAIVGCGNSLGRPIALRAAEDHMFGCCLLNDWSARDIQQWEYQPLGPFLGKNFATTLSPWIVTLEALEPYRVRPAPRGDDAPGVLAYLEDPGDRLRGGIDITLEVWLASSRMRELGLEPVRLSVSSFRDMYWTIGQMVTHHASGGCNLKPGDVLASGTVSGPSKESRGCLLELTWRGSEPLVLPSGETRTFLEDGDLVRLRASCRRSGAARVGFGVCDGVVTPALPSWP